MQMRMKMKMCRCMQMQVRMYNVDGHVHIDVYEYDGWCYGCCGGRWCGGCSFQKELSCPDSDKECPAENQHKH